MGFLLMNDINAYYQLQSDEILPMTDVTAETLLASSPSFGTEMFDPTGAANFIELHIPPIEQNDEGVEYCRVGSALFAQQMMETEEGQAIGRGLFNVVNLMIHRDRIADVFLHTFGKYGVAEGIPWFAGAAVDIVRGGLVSNWNLFRHGEMPNPLQYLAGNPDRSFAARWGEWGKDTLGEPITAVLGVDHVETRFDPEATGNMWQRMTAMQVSFDNEETWQDATNAGYHIAAVFGVLAGPENLASFGLSSLGRGAKAASVIYNTLDYANIGGAMVMPIADQLLLEPGRLQRILDDVSDDGYFNRNANRRDFQRDLNRLNKHIIRRDFEDDDSVSDYRSIDIDGALGDEGLDNAMMRRFGLAINKIRVSTSGALSDQDRRTLEALNNFDTKAEQIIADYEENPQEFRFNADSALTLQIYLSSVNGSAYLFGTSPEAVEDLKVQLDQFIEDRNNQTGVTPTAMEFNGKADPSVINPDQSLILSGNPEQPDAARLPTPVPG